MPGSVCLPVVGDHEQVVGTLRIAALDGRRAAPIWDLQGEARGGDGLAPVQVIEGAEYIYEFDVLINGRVRTDREEIFQRDDAGGKRGRLRPGEHVGLLPIRVLLDEKSVGFLSLEVRSRKLDYVSHYRWMLRDLATIATGLLTERFAPTETLLEPQATEDEATLYQQFAFLYSFITGPQLESALAQVLSRPHRTWLTVREKWPPSIGLRGNSNLLRRLVGPGPRIPWPHDFDHPLVSLPVTVEAVRAEETLDTAENRFVKFALEHWRELVESVRRSAQEWENTPTRQRAMLETEEAFEILDAALGQELFRSIGALRRFPASSSVLQGREGYREIFFAYIQAEVASGLVWDGGSDVFGAGQRDVATMYEFWTFLQLVEIIRELCPQHDLGDLLELSKDRMTLNLRRNRTVAVRGDLYRLGRRLEIALFFNKVFSRLTKGPLDGSWSTSLRPDCSVRIRVSPGTGSESDVVWMHFDAKYRVERLQEVFGRAIESEGDELNELAAQEEAEKRGRVKISDLLKMHAYLAAIRRATGAYVMYPGSTPLKIRRYDELLPGLGAFPLFPTEEGPALGVSAIATFLDDACTHLANQATQEERARYWSRVTYEEAGPVAKKQRALSILSQPPADTPVLVSHLLTESELAVLEHDRLYAIPDEIAESSALPIPALGADLLLARSTESVKAWRLRPFHLRFLTEGTGSLGRAKVIRLAVELAEGPFDLSGLQFPDGTGKELLSGRLIDFLAELTN